MAGLDKGIGLGDADIGGFGAGAAQRDPGDPGDGDRCRCRRRESGNGRVFESLDGDVAGRCLHLGGRVLDIGLDLVADFVARQGDADGERHTGDAVEGGGD